MSQHIARSPCSECHIVHVAQFEMNFNVPSLPLSNNATPRSSSRDFVCDENRLELEIPISNVQPAGQQFNAMIDSKF